jgi:hypothetical protein
MQLSGLACRSSSAALGADGHLNLSPPPAPRRLHGGRRRWRPHGPDPHRSRRLGNGDPAVTQSGRKRPQTAAMCHEPPALAESPQVQEITAHDAAHGSSPETRGCPGSNRVSPPQVREGPTQEASAARRFLPQTAHPFTPLVTARLDAPIATVEVGILGVFASGVFAGGVGVHELLASRRRPLPKRFQRGRWDRVAAAPGKQTAADSCGFLRADERIRTADPFITSEVLYQLSYVGVLRAKA